MGHDAGLFPEGTHDLLDHAGLGRGCVPLGARGRRRAAPGVDDARACCRLTGFDRSGVEASQASQCRARATAKPMSLELPSALSSDIERFVKQSGRDLSTPARSPSTPTLATARESRHAEASRPPLPVAPPPLAGRSGRPGSSPPSPLATIPTLKAAPYGPDDRRFPINFATTLRLADARPLVIAAAQARVWIAEAELTRAKVLWLPELNIGFDYIRHDGGGPDFAKSVLTTPSVNFFYAGGGLYGVLALSDAIYAPLVARQVLNARHWDTQGAKNDALMQTADAYFLVHQYRGIYTGALYTVGLAGQLVKEIQELGRDLVPAYEVDRARNMVADLQQQAVSARQQWRVQSARLTPCCGSTRARSSNRWSTTTPRSRCSIRVAIWMI